MVVRAATPYKGPAMTDNTMAAPAAPMAASASASSASSLTESANNTTFAIILSLSFCHLLNDMMQSLVPALYPILKDNYGLSFARLA
jgi:FSR family fosmidomycin resistance protein-like MFS transporter